MKVDSFLVYRIGLSPWNAATWTEIVLLSPSGMLQTVLWVNIVKRPFIALLDP